MITISATSLTLADQNSIASTGRYQQLTRARELLEHSFTDLASADNLEDLAELGEMGPRHLVGIRWQPSWHPLASQMELGTGFRTRQCTFYPSKTHEPVTES
jgi:hypothetical protein